MQSRLRRSRIKAENVAVANVIVQDIQILLQLTAVVEADRLAARKIGDLRRQVLLHRTKNQPQRRIKLEISLGRPRRIVVGLDRTIGRNYRDRRIHMPDL